MKAHATLLVWTLGLAACSAAAPALPRIERYDFMGETPSDLSRLRQMAPAEGPEGALSRYALARAHADWLVLALIRDRDDDVLLRRLAMDLGVEGATPDDSLALEQVMTVFDLVLDEIGQAGAAGPEARAWGSHTGRLLRGVRDGWEQFSPPLFHAVTRASSREGPARQAADLLAVGWGRLALDAVRQRPAREQAPMLARMAAYHDPRLVSHLHEHPGDLAGAAVPFTCEGVRSQARGLEGAALSRLVRSSCSDDDLGLPAGGGAAASVELLVTARILADLVERRSRLAGASGDPLVAAAAPDLHRFDSTLRALRLPLPLPVPGPALAAPPSTPEGSIWRPAAAVLVGDREGAARVALWPVLGVTSAGAVALVDHDVELALPGRPVEGDLQEEIRATWQAAARRLGVRQRTVAVVVPADATAGHLVDLVAAAQEAGASRVDLVAVAPDGAVATLPVQAGRGAARTRTSGDRRAVVVLEASGVLVGDADGHWTEVQDSAEGLAMDRITPALGQHLSGRGNAGCIVAVRPGCDVSRVAAFVESLSPRRDGTAPSPRWRVWLDDREPPAPERAASTVAEAISLHRVRLRDCYERYLREGGEAEGLVVLELAVATDGHVVEARVLRTELGGQPALEECLLGESRRIRFPDAAESRTLHVPLRLVPRGD